MNDLRGSVVHEATTVVHTGQSHCIETPVSPVVLAAAEESPFSGPITTGPLLPGLSLTQGFDSESFVVSAHTAAPVTAARTGTEQVAEKPANTAVSTAAVSTNIIPTAAVSTNIIPTSVVSTAAVSTAAVSTAAVSTAAAARGDAPAAFASDFTGEPSSWCIEPNLAARGPAYSVMRECLARQEAASPRGRLGRALGSSPLHPDARSWYSGALGEIVVANALAQLGEGWTVLHAVPVGSASAEIDHLILGPGGIFTINTKNHSGKKIWIGGSTFLVNGYKQEHMRNSAHQAERASRLLSSVTGRPVTVTPLIVVVNPSSVTTGRKQPRVTVLSSNALKRWLVKRPRVLSDRAVAHFSMFAEERSTWHTEPVTIDDTTDRLCRFGELRIAVDAARQRARLWLLVLGVGAILITPVAIAQIVRLLVSFLVIPGR